MFYVKHSEGGCEPLVRCHVCNRRIEALAEAVVVYERSVDEGLTSRAAIVHRGACLAQAKAMLANDRGEPHALAFDAFLSRLRANSEAEYCY